MESTSRTKPFENLNYSAKLFICNKYCQDVTSKETQKTLINDYHDETHNGITETYNQFKNKYFWPNMRQTITETFFFILIII